MQKWSATMRRPRGPMMLLGALLALVIRPGLAAPKPTPAQLCAVAKFAAIRNKIAGEFRCYATATNKGSAVDGACIGKVVEKFNAAFAKAEAKGGCFFLFPGFGDAQAVEGDVDTCVATVAADEPGTPVMGRFWHLGAGEDAFVCRTVQIPFDLYITGFRNVSPPGTYEMIVTLSDQANEVGDYDCTLGTTLGRQGIYASGINTGDLVFPPGFGVHVRAGEYVNVTLHVANTAQTDMSGDSTVLPMIGAPADVVDEAEMAFAGTLNIDIPSDGVAHIAQGGCNAPQDEQILALWPHLQATGTHATLTVTHAGTPRMVLDVPFTVTDQPIYPMTPPVAVQTGDQIQAVCTYVNTTGSTEHYGDSARDEQCFIGMYRSPVIPGGNVFDCVN
jgi:hypothetical protein